MHYTGVIDDVEENETITPFIYESDTSDGEGSEEAMETDQENEKEEEFDGALDGVSDFEGIEDEYSERRENLSAGDGFNDS
ncbi:hypothetical protein C1H46_020799 [Malus baccata]|uniref:Uncharacterized protein n=1 Tax=Malus baccata TaxID=106549 RepID=A0A540M4C4_MALBA|nr:hypothetical protein C1H46_020799 [Malus baccata]